MTFRATSFQPAAPLQCVRAPARPEHMPTNRNVHREHPFYSHCILATRLLSPLPTRMQESLAHSCENAAFRKTPKRNNWHSLRETRRNMIVALPPKGSKYV